MKRLNAADSMSQASHAHGCVDTGSTVEEAVSRTFELIVDTVKV